MEKIDIKVEDISTRSIKGLQNNTTRNYPNLTPLLGELPKAMDKKQSLHVLRRFPVRLSRIATMYPHMLQPVSIAPPQLSTAIKDRNVTVFKRQRRYLGKMPPNVQTTPRLQWRTLAKGVTKVTLIIVALPWEVFGPCEETTMDMLIFISKATRVIF